MKKRRKNILQSTTLDAIKAMRRGGREAEIELLGPGFAFGEDAHARESTMTILIPLAYSHHSFALQSSQVG